ncbi:MAG: methyltransferase domain-containing protein [Kutzneria sp.]|nr:methyltransferase domain-containing protein [Kutzneria sp.]MBV9843583.1 methyltransferase domain-containing protein [Kutzneria sp.]
MIRVPSWLANAGYKLKAGPTFNEVPDSRLVEVVEGAGEDGRALPAGRRALDLGCGTGRNTLYLARHGWEAVGVEYATSAVKRARARAQELSVDARFVTGDVTKLPELGIGDGFSLLTDSGCYHMLSPGQRDAYARGITEAATKDALLIMTGFTSLIGALTQAEITSRLTRWRLVRARPIPGTEMAEYTSGSLVQAALRAGLGKAWRFELRKR